MQRPILPPFPFVEEWNAVIAANGFYKGQYWGALPINWPTSGYTTTTNTNTASCSDGNGYDAHLNQTSQHNALDLEPSQTIWEEGQGSNVTTSNDDISRREPEPKAATKRRPLQPWEKKRALRRQQRRHREDHQRLQAEDEARWRQQQVEWKQRQTQGPVQADLPEATSQHTVPVGSSGAWQTIEVEKDGIVDDPANQQGQQFEQLEGLGDDRNANDFVEIDPEFAERFARAEARIEGE
jgi:hypothetical protein